VICGVDGDGYADAQAGETNGTVEPLNIIEWGTGRRRGRAGLLRNTEAYYHGNTIVIREQTEPNNRTRDIPRFAELFFAD